MITPNYIYSVEEYKTIKEAPLYFHKGRGGHYNNQGYVTYVGEMTFGDVCNRCDDLFEINRDKNGRFCKPYLADGNGNWVSDNKWNDTYGTLDFDGEYDTDYIDTAENLTHFKDAIARAYRNDDLSTEIEALFLMNDSLDEWSDIDRIYNNLCFHLDSGRDVQEMEYDEVKNAYIDLKKQEETMQDTTKLEEELIYFNRALLALSVKNFIEEY